AALWSDLAAAETLVFIRKRDDGGWLTALVAANHALALDGRFAPALFNRALLMETVGVAPAARQYWTAYLAADAASAWAAVARRHLGSRKMTQAEAWLKQVPRLDALSSTELASLARRFPLEARTYGEGPFLSSWA